MAQIGLLCFAGLLFWVGMQGLLGNPDKNGKKTHKGVAVGCLLTALAVLAVTYVITFHPTLIDLRG